MSTSIGPVGQLVAVIQAQLASRGPAARVAGKRPSALAQQSAQQKLAGLIEKRVRQIDRHDPQRGRKAFRVFLEAVLLSHFGESLVNDPAFHQVVSDVQGAMEADAACRALVDDAIGYLLAPTP
ncbi:hypothetical protein [Massilia sp. BJB1822]|uniref:hypothetical protein n=1 Tax=Massilia sp. BJB1822 TaxID=2744470 RepID=UPI001593BB9F|nr:hypothetical protein [Massilia sp. BJB1822]NVE01848.1 hypothetical protein [Massilia sp. BJB1822]